MIEPLNLFYAEPDPDRWIRFDRYPRRVIRRLVRGPARPGGQARVFLNLRAGLDRLGVPYRVNDFRHALRHPDQLVCIVGKPCVLDAAPWRNPILFGASVFSHPVDDPLLFERLSVRRLLVPGEWCRAMFAESFGDRVEAWPVGIDTELWSPTPARVKDVDVLVYDKIRWHRDQLVPELLDIVLRVAERRGLRARTLRYGAYREDEFRALLARSRAMIFLCEHETQGIAYQQALASGVPILAWDRGGEWRDPSYHPHRVRYGPVSSVPYWDARCGLKFADAGSFGDRLDEFVSALDEGRFAPRPYILENLTLERTASAYLAHVEELRGGRRGAPAAPEPSALAPTPRTAARRGLS